MDPMAKAWMGTSYLETPPSMLNGVYLIYQREKCPQTGRLHWQFLVVYEQRKRLTYVKKRFVGAHLEICRNILKSRDYCRKEETRVSSPVEEGTFPDQGPLGKMVSPLQLLRQKGVIEVIEENPQFWRNYRTLRDLRCAVATPRIAMTSGIILSGPTGVGKSKIANIIASYVGKTYHQDGSAWWDGYDNEDLVVIDEYRGQFPVNFLLRLIDRYPMKVQIKGSQAQFTSSACIMTSNLSLVEMYPGMDHKTLCALVRRIIVLEVY